MIYLGLFLLSMFLTYSIRHYAIKKSILDIPNERSSHTLPTPRGGGLAIVITFYVALFFLKETIESRLFYAFFTAIPIVLISLLDDIFMLSSKIRLLVQSFSALLALYFLGGVNSIDFTYFVLSGWWLNILAFLLILWLTNLYNFLDGIDGYAGSQALLLGLGLFFIFSQPLGLAMAAATLGFLLFNWSKASIFMGDVGSATLGFLFAIWIFSDTSQGNIYFWLVGLSLFWFDATVTLFRRYRNGEKITQAHKKHAYQRLVQSGWSHQKVALSLILFISIFLFLLNWFSNWGFIFLVNILGTIFIAIYIETRKSFYNV